MIVSFDLDGLLIPFDKEFEIEKCHWAMKYFSVEPLRLGTSILFKQLQKEEHEVWIYTTSFRSIFKIRKTFFAHGLSPKKIINGNMNQKILRNHHCSASKNPRLFGIDFHVDDSVGVESEGRKFNFQTIAIPSHSENWVEEILNAIP